MKKIITSLLILSVVVLFVFNFVQDVAIRANKTVILAQAKVLNAQDEVMKAQSNVILNLFNRMNSLDGSTTKPKPKELEIEFNDYGLSESDVLQFTPSISSLE